MFNLLISGDNKYIAGKYTHKTLNRVLENMPAVSDLTSCRWKRNKKWGWFYWKEVSWLVSLAKFVNRGTVKL